MSADWVVRANCGVILKEGKIRNGFHSRYLQGSK